MNSSVGYLLVGIFSMLSVVVFSQEFEGLVIDKETNKPIEGASVYFDNTTIGTTTNTKGEFFLTKVKIEFMQDFFFIQ